MLLVTGSRVRRCKLGDEDARVVDGVGVLVMVKSREEVAVSDPALAVLA